MAQSNIKQLFSSITSTVDDDFQQFQPLNACAKKTNLNPSTIVLPLILIVIIICLLTSVIAHYTITLFAMVYPSYMSFKAIHHNQDELRKKWLTYWIVFSFATAFDKILSVVLFFLPAFYAFKVLFFIWLFYPRTDGAGIIYEKVLKPRLKSIKQSLSKLSK